MSDIDLRNRAAFFRNPDYVKHGFPGHLIEPLAVELEWAADALEVAEQRIAELKAELTHANEVIDRVALIRLDLEAHNKRLRAALERISLACDSLIEAQNIAREALAQESDGG